MDALKQYIDLYDQNVELVEGGSCAVMNRLRQDARDMLYHRPLPDAGSENYEHTDLNEILSPDYGINISRVPLEVNPSASFRCDVPNLSTALFLVLNDSFAETTRSRNQLPEGVTIGSLKRMGEQYPDLVGGHYGKLADIANPVTALNTMLVQDGVFIHVKAGVHLEKPLQLVNIFSNGAPLMALRRLLIIMEDDSEAKLLVCDHTQNPEVNYLGVQTVEIFAGKNSRFDLYDLEESTEKTSRLSTYYLRQESGSNVMLDGITLFNGTTRNEYYCCHKGEHTELNLLGMAIEDLGRRVDNLTDVLHESTDGHTNELFKYVVDDTSRGAFAGRIYVAPGACRTEAYQSNRNIVGSSEARMFSKPQLEIYNDDVKCSHGTAIGQLDDMQVFYMRSRGIPEATARLLLKQAFLSDVIDGVRLPVLRDRLHQLVERRFAGEHTLCADCGVNCKPTELNIE